MALVFTVGTPRDVYEPKHADFVRDILEERFGDLNLRSRKRAWCSEELGWSGWTELQKRCVKALGKKAAPHLQSMEAWNGAYLPVDVEPQRIETTAKGTALDVAALRALVRELEAFGDELDLPTDDDELESFARRYSDDDDLCDEDMDLQTWAWLLIGAREATKRRQPLWVVK